MTMAIIIMVMWAILGIYSIYADSRKDNIIPFIVFVVVIPFFPWIFKFCGL